VLRHRVAAAAALVVVLGECGAIGSPRDMTEVAADVRPVDAGAIDTAAAPVLPRTSPTPPPPPPAAATSVAPLPDTVEVVRPTLRIDGLSPADALEAMYEATDTEGVRAALAVPVATFTVPGPEGDAVLTALVVESDDLRAYTPEVTANEPGVWERLREGNVVLTPAAANRVGAELGQPVTLVGPNGSEAARVGALAANGVPQLADALVPAWLAEHLLPSMERSLLVAVEDDNQVAGIARALEQALEVEVTRLVEPRTRQAGSGVSSGALEPFTYQSVGDGTIRIAPDWVRRHIVTAEVPILGRVTCHRIIIPQLTAALQEIERAGLADVITTYDGCWVPRHMLWDANRAISRHAWGVAFDINARTNGYGARPTLDPRVVEIFQRWGFRWGGNFSTPDGMHFELERVIQP
jgi:hypothetical protein